jgi:hypothetical protein
MRFGESVLRRGFSVRPGQTPMRIGARSRIPQARNIFDFPGSSLDTRKRRSQQILES